MLEPLGQSQVIAYLEKLAPDYAIHLVSFEKQKDRTDAPRVAKVAARLKAAGIAWTPLAYHKTPSAPATAYDIAIGTTVASAIAERGPEIIMTFGKFVGGTCSFCFILVDPGSTTLFFKEAILSFLDDRSLLF